MTCANAALESFGDGEWITSAAAMPASSCKAAKALA
jgi:hypothetical protein